jgi:chorismate dehydratase
MNNINLVAVSYLNTKPFLAGLNEYISKNIFQNIGYHLTVELQNPAVCAQKLQTQQSDLGLIPAAKIPFITNAAIISNYCIGATEAVKTVCLFSKLPLQQIKTIYLDYQSRTSAQLVQILARYYWKINPVFLAAPANFEQNLSDLDSFLMIGDRAIGLEKRFEYTYDLAENWQRFSNLPFVFAAWVANKNLPANFLDCFEQSLRYGISQRNNEAKRWQANFPEFDVAHYFNKAISYDFDKDKKAGLKLFLELAATFQPGF